MGIHKSYLPTEAATSSLSQEEVGWLQEHTPKPTFGFWQGEHAVSKQTCDLGRGRCRGLIFAVFGVCTLREVQRENLHKGGWN